MCAPGFAECPISTAECRTARGGDGVTAVLRSRHRQQRRSPSLAERVGQFQRHKGGSARGRWRSYNRLRSSSNRTTGSPQQCIMPLAPRVMSKAHGAAGEVITQGRRRRPARAT